MNALFGRVGVVAIAAASLLNSIDLAFAEESKSDGLVMVVMDPLAAQLACPCVKGYAQRDYKKLAVHLETVLGRPVKIVFDESLEAAVERGEAGGAEIVIGKQSVVEHDARAAKLTLQPVAALSDLQGATTQTGLFVVEKGAAAQSLRELAGYHILFGPKYCDEKHLAAIESLKANGVTLPEELATCNSCSDGAEQLVEAGPQKKMAAVISSYAKPLLEGCGTIKKGDLRVVGETEPVPFIQAYVSGKLSEQDRKAITESLLEVKDDPLLCKAIESRAGFVTLDPDSSEAPVAKVSKKNYAKRRRPLTTNR